MNCINHLGPQYCGAIYGIIGLLILLDELNVLSKSIHLFVVLAAIGLVVYGIKISGLLDLISKKN
jgi:hypothetical protein